MGSRPCQRQIKSVFICSLSRDELLDQIRTGVTLRKVDLDSLSSGGSNEAVPSGIAGMLQKALQERSGKIKDKNKMPSFTLTVNPL